MPEISVIIPTFNRKEKLAAAVRSVLAQKGPGFELIVSDDGSTDGTGDMIARDFPSVVYVRQDNAGPAAARNRGIEKARGEWITFLDSDDEWKSGKLAAQLDFMKNHPEYPICQTEEIWIRRGRRVNPMKKHRKSGGWIFEPSLALCLISPSAVMMRRTLLDEVGLFDESLPACEDYDLWLRITARFPVGLIETPYVIRYGGHPDQRSQAFEGMDRFRILSLVKIIRAGGLRAEQEKCAQAMLAEKAGIYIRGAVKRGRSQEAAQIRERVTAALPAGYPF